MWTSGWQTLILWIKCQFLKGKFISCSTTSYCQQNGNVLPRCRLSNTKCSRQYTDPMVQYALHGESLVFATHQTHCTLFRMQNKLHSLVDLWFAMSGLQYQWQRYSTKITFTWPTNWSQSTKRLLLLQKICLSHRYQETLTNKPSVVHSTGCDTV